ncbi:YdaS antitoxin of YdaST toxin-antitoxin system [Dyadobacter jejuensis]|uniref:YdaS antitoxin of YdaST toxin-antitoxin system n=1 Tax=Dyadobacter jejuensis TaxID=1082580 RepID=A0A316A6I1_9BACT|nr:helix-turn-helix transcriptional regulator [Dyadobacter jejuensis]PWJ52848.1 YdaS antitoxin of YdaST toxin-antitoxin system [Dyadobacter jejuensis]
MTAKEALHHYYKESGDSQPEIASKLKISQSSVHNWLSGKKEIPMESYCAIAKLCGIELLQLLPEDWKSALANEK